MRRHGHLVFWRPSTADPNPDLTSPQRSPSFSARTLSLIAVIAVSLLAAACSGGESTEELEGSSETVNPVTTSTAAQPSTTSTVATTTSTNVGSQATTSTSVGSDAQGYALEASPLTTMLFPGGEQAIGLIPMDSVEAAWYQWDSRYVVLFRGLGVVDHEPLCAATSITQDEITFDFSSAAPLGSASSDTCPSIPSPQSPAGLYECGALTYFVTEIPTTAEGFLVASLGRSTDGVWVRFFGGADPSRGAAPEFVPGSDAYSLPDTTVESAQQVSCG